MFSTESPACSAVTPAVSEGVFDDGPATMLWNPHRSPSPTSYTMLPEVARPSRILHAVGGVATMVTAACWATGYGAVLAIMAGAAALGCAVLGVLVDVKCFATDHAHGPGRRCCLEARPGEFFYRGNDFTDLGPAVHTMATRIVDAVDHVHTSPAAAWLDPSVLREIHLVAWNALHCLDQTRTIRILAHQLAGEPDTDGVRHRLETAIAAIDRTTQDVIDQLAACVALVEAWTQKLHHVDLQRRADNALKPLEDLPAVHVAAAAESLPVTVFAYITAARDVVNAGPFPWEHPHEATASAEVQRVPATPPRETALYT